MRQFPFAFGVITRIEHSEKQCQNIFCTDYQRTEAYRILSRKSERFEENLIVTYERRPSGSLYGGPPS